MFDRFKYELILKVKQNKAGYAIALFLLSSGIFAGITTSLNFSEQTVLDILFFFHSAFDIAEDAALIYIALVCMWNVIWFYLPICAGGIWLFMFPLSIIVFLTKGFCIGLIWCTMCFSSIQGFLLFLLTLCDMLVYIRLFTLMLAWAFVNVKMHSVPRTNMDRVYGAKKYLDECFKMFALSCMIMILCVYI